MPFSPMLNSSSVVEGLGAAAQMEDCLLSEDGAIPNNPKLPLVIYRRACNCSGDNAAVDIARLLRRNDWSNSWRNGIYDYHHYHSIAHEVLIVVQGTVKVQFGGEHGVIRELEPGDAVVIPAGVAHKNLGSSHTLSVVGAYARGQNWDICYGRPEERPAADQRIARVSLPKTDPIYGAEGPLLQKWGIAEPTRG